MQRVAGWIGRRDALLAVAAAAIGLAIGYFDSQPTDRRDRGRRPGARA